MQKQEEINLELSGSLTAEKVDRFAEALYDFLKNKKFVIVEIKREQSLIIPEVKVGQRLQENQDGKVINVFHSKDEKNSAGLQIFTSCGDFKVRPGVENPSVMFCKKQVVIKWKNPQGKEEVLIFALEKPLLKVERNKR